MNVITKQKSKPKNAEVTGKHCAKINKILSYRRETALQGAL